MKFASKRLVCERKMHWLHKKLCNFAYIKQVSSFNTILNKKASACLLTIYCFTVIFRDVRIFNILPSNQNA